MARKKIIPKRIGSIKIPKKLRKLGDQVLADPRSREVAGSVLLSLGAALASRAAPKGSVFRNIFDHPVETAKKAEAAGADAAQATGDTVSDTANLVGQVVTEVVDAVRRDLARKFRPERSNGSKADKDDEEDRVH